MSVTVDRWNITVDIAVEDLIKEIDNDDLIAFVAERGIDDEILEAVDNYSIAEHVRHNPHLTALVLDNMDDALLEHVASNRGILSLEHVETDDLLNELRQRHAMPKLTIPADVQTAIDFLSEWSRGIVAVDDPTDKIGKRFA